VAAVRKRLGNFILAEDDGTLEGAVLSALAAAGGTLAVVESFTSGAIAARLAHLPGAERLFRRGLVARDGAALADALGLTAEAFAGEFTPEMAELAARAAARASGASHALASLVAIDEGPDRIELGGTISLAIASGERAVLRRARIVGGREWVRLGAVELSLDFLRRHLLGLPTDERIDFEKV